MATSGPHKGYFTEDQVLDRVPALLLILASLYFVMGITGALLIIQPPGDWLVRCAIKKKMKEEARAACSREASPGDSDSTNSLNNLSITSSEDELGDPQTNKAQAPIAVSWKKALRTKELYLLWVTRLSVVLITQVIAALYKAFGQTFIFDDHFLSMVGAVSSFFNCSGRLLYGFIMDKTSYKVGMSLEAILLTLLMSTFYLTSFVGQEQTVLQTTSASNLSAEACKLLEAELSRSGSATNFTRLITDNAANLHFLTTSQTLESMVKDCSDHSPILAPETPLSTKIVYALWVWSIFLTFPGTYAMQPAVTTQTFGHR